MMRRCLVLLALPLLSACGSISVTSESVPSFNPASQVWQVESSAGSNRHKFILTSVGGYCSKKKKAEADRITALERHQERLADDYGVCESEDLYLDDLAAAYRSLNRPGARYLLLNIDREGAVTWDDRTFPEAGSFNQVGATDTGRFVGQIQAFEGRIEQARADAYTCLSPDEEDAAAYNAFLFEEEADLFAYWSLDGGNLNLASADDDSWDVDVTATLLQGSSSVGSVQANFTAERCAVPVTAETL
jgi:hypothetical protein